MAGATEIMEQGKHELAPQDVCSQVALIQEIMRRVMKEDEHFGCIPGCGPKPTLLKPGAEKLSLTFRLTPKYTVVGTDLPDGHREYFVKCALHHIATGNHVGEGVGCCTTMERKYRFRKDPVPNAPPITQEYWDTRDPELLGGARRTVRKQKGKWVVVQEVEHDNPADYWNTCLKIGKKRAHVDAVLTATAASDIFTQDLEDMPVQATATPAANQAPAKPAPVAVNGDPSSPFAVVLKFPERHRGKTLGDVLEQEPSCLVWMRDEALPASIDNPEKARFRDSNIWLLNAVTAVLNATDDNQPKEEDYVPEAGS